MKIQLTQIITINNRHKYYASLDKLCFKSKNLYNATLYEIRQYYFKEKKYLNYYAVNRLFHDSEQYDYIEMPYAQSSQHVLRQVDSAFNSFFKALHSPKMEGKTVKPPKYKDKENGRNIVVYTKQCFIKHGNDIKLKLDNEGNFITITTDKQNVQEVRIVPRGNHIKIEIIYNEEYKSKADNGRYAAIDLGLNNLCTLTSNVCSSIIYNGRPLKQINHMWNKKKAELQSKLPQKIHTSKRLKHLAYKRNNKVKDYLHKISSAIVEHLESNQLNTLIVGKNKGWKDGINLGHVTNQNFVSIPYNMLLQMLEYKCKMKGINFIIVNEAYTSKCSFLDQEKIRKRKKYLGTRKQRGMFISSKGIRINADVNGSLNILRIGCEKLNVKLDVLTMLRPENMRFVLNPVIFNLAS